jgi:hypothetical protein
MALLTFDGFPQFRPYLNSLGFKGDRSDPSSLASRTADHCQLLVQLDDDDIDDDGDDEDEFAVLSGEVTR